MRGNRALQAGNMKKEKGKEKKHTRILAAMESAYASISFFASSMACCVFFLLKDQSIKTKDRERQRKRERKREEGRERETGQ